MARYDVIIKDGTVATAADTFRAAAVEQICVWGERLGVDVVHQRQGADPAAVVFDALRAARARKVTRVIVDTAGRLHTKDNLMAELAKIHRVIGREAGEWQRYTLLVLDATTGQNAISQAREFTKVAAVDGVVLTKLDGTAKGGMAVAVARVAANAWGSLSTAHTRRAPSLAAACSARFSRPCRRLRACAASCAVPRRCRSRITAATWPWASRKARSRSSRMALKSESRRCCRRSSFSR